MASLFVVTCDHCNRDCTTKHIEVTLVVEDRTMSEDTRSKQYCSTMCAESGMDNTGGMPK